MGIILYALTTGKHPFRKESEAATIYNIIDKSPAVPPRRIVPGYPAALERVVQQALAKDPGKRFPTANEFLRALDQALPPSMRASTDEDVGAFLKGLFSERRDQQREAFAKALEGADQRAESRVSLRSFLDSQPPPPPNSGITPVSDVSLSTMAATRQTLESGSDVAMPTGSGQTLSSPIMRPGGNKRRWVVGLVAAGVLLVGGGVVLLEAGGGASAAKPAPSAQSVAAAVPATPTPAPAESDTTEVVEASALPVEPPPPSASAEPALSAAPAPKPHPVYHPRAHHTVKKSTATKTGNNWREDPGF
jgi:serine/threonine-protein kinase